MGTWGNREGLGDEGAPATRARFRSQNTHEAGDGLDKAHDAFSKARDPAGVDIGGTGQERAYARARLVYPFPRSRGTPSVEATSRNGPPEGPAMSLTPASGTSTGGSRPSPCRGIPAVSGAQVNLVRT
jgi:hypothetical protein